jgi:hypothetical protein
MMKKTKPGILIACILCLCLTSRLSGQNTILELKEKIIDIQNQGELAFRNFTLCTNIIGYGQYVPVQGNKVKSNTTIYFYYEPENLFTNRVGGAYQMWFTQDMIVLEADGTELYNASELLNFNYQTTSPVLDVFASNSLELGELAPGKYIFKAVMHDKLKKVDESYSFTFEVIQ